MSKGTHVKFESTISYGKEIMGNVSFLKVGQDQGRMFQFLVPSERSCHKEHTC